MAVLQTFTFGTMTYKLKITEDQAYVLSAACELFARLGMGQIRNIVDFLPLNCDYEDRHAFEDALSSLYKMISARGIDGWRSSLGIQSEDVTIGAKRAWELYEVIRHRLSWDMADREGWINPDGRRNWNKMMGVNFDEPHGITGEGLAKMEQEAE